MNAFIKSLISIASTYIKEEIRSDAARRKRLNPISQELDELDARIYELEKQKKDEANKSSEALGWSTINEAVTRGQNAPECGWILPGIITEGAICNIQSAEKAGKSILVTQISHDCAYGISSELVPWKDDKYPIHAQQVFYYDAEMSDDDMAERYENLDDDKIHRHPGGFNKPEDFLNHLECSLSNIQSNTLVVVDNVSAICIGFYENNVKEVNRKIADLRQEFLKRGYRLSFIFVHHIKKESDGKNTSDRAGSANWSRLATINLSFYAQREDKRILEVSNKRCNKTALSPQEGIVLDYLKEPYPHYVYNNLLRNDESIIMPDAPKSAAVEKKPGPKSTQPELTDEQLSQMKIMVEAIESKKPVTIEGIEYKTKKSIAEYFNLLPYSHYVDRALKDFPKKASI